MPPPHKRVLPANTHPISSFSLFDSLKSPFLFLNQTPSGRRAQNQAMIPDTPPPPESNQPSPSSPTEEEETEEEEDNAVVDQQPQPKHSEEEFNAAASDDRKKSGSTRDDDDPDDGRRPEVIAPREAEAAPAPAERLRRHRMEMAGGVWIPEMWGQEGMLKEWIDSSVFDRFLVPNGLLSARDALVVEGCRRRKPATGG